MRAFLPLVALIFATLTSCAAAQPTTAPAAGKFPHVEVDARRKQVRITCEALRVEAPLEFFCCVAGTNEHEAVLRSAVKPSHLHAALLMIGLEPGEPVRYSEAAKRWIPPHGPPLRISVEFEKDGKMVARPAYKLMRSVKTKQPMPALTWIFAGSRVMEDGNYAADVTGYLVSIVNFDLTVIDVPALASNANEMLEWETNLDEMPAAGAAVTMVIEPAGQKLEGPPLDGLGAAGPIGVPVIKVGRGELSLDDRPLSPAELDAGLAKLRDAGRAQVRIAAADDAPPLLVETVRRIAAKNALEVVEARPPAHAPDPTRGDRNAVTLDQQRLGDLRARWDKAVKPHAAALREAAQTQYDVIAELRREQQRLIDEADRIQRVIDELEREYQEMTTPRPPSERPKQP
jgi:hypothetical protein